MCCSHHGAVGDGPARLAYQGALEARLKDHQRWNMIGNGTYYTLNFSVPTDFVDPSLVREYKIDGALTALLLIHLLVEPAPISPFLIYAASVSTWAMEDLPLNYLLSWIPDEDTRNLITAIHAFKSTDTVSLQNFATHPVAARADNLNLPASFFTTTRDDATNDKIKVQIIASTLVGHPTPWQHRYFQAFAQGFNLGFLGKSDLISVRIFRNNPMVCDLQRIYQGRYQ
jgi:hypothetical protein